MNEFSQLKAIFFSKLENYCENFGNNFLIAVSGGGDSLALAKLCQEFSLSRSDISFQACIIDHRIANNSSEVAANAAMALDKIGISNKILAPNFEIQKPLQENARKARFDILTQYAQEIGACGILLGHNFDDQIETFIFRLLRNTRLLGLGAIEEIRKSFEFSCPALFLRPLMHSKRSELRDFLRHENIEYFDDPANENQNFTRVAIRKKLKKIEINQQLILKVSAQSQNLKRNLDKIGLDFLASNSKFLHGKIFIDLNNFKPLSPSLQIHILGRIIESFANNNHPISHEKLQLLSENVQKPNFKSQTLANILIKKSKQQLVFETAPLRKHQKNIIINKNPLQLESRLWARFNHFGDIHTSLG